ncbi:MAG: cyclase family protein [Thermoplasmatales archaeon]
MRIYDLSMPIEEGMPYFKGDPIPEVRQFKNIREDGYNMKELTIGTHTGTHLDAPSHFIEGGKTVDQLDILDLRGRATCISYEPMNELDLPEEHYDIILLYTGYNKNWKNFKTFENFSYIKGEDARKLRDYGVKLVGIDSPSAEIQNSKGFETHHILLGASIPIAENLNSIPLSGLVGHSFTVQVVPIIVKDGDGAPARIIALEE